MNFDYDAETVFETVAEQLYFRNAPVAHVVAYENVLRETRLRQMMKRAARR